ncbi:hypothetical protein [Paenibacillus sp. LK1]|uniref:hypothetical protein n=1 Tax=Paenibacillus sp. LK1 TaxID=2053014 RepID=UPI000C19F4AB|nr:hypothetical protein [Paenibacillus sp. LK1]PIH59118.1 hypothetical protein CS562_14360 [Paenibacillus sp. LK1]
MSVKVPKKIIVLADSVYSHLLSARAAEAKIMEWLRSKGYEPNDSDVFGMLSNAEYGGKDFAEALEDAIECGELEKID